MSKKKKTAKATGAKTAAKATGAETAAKAKPATTAKPAATAKKGSGGRIIAMLALAAVLLLCFVVLKDHAPGHEQGSGKNGGQGTQNDTVTVESGQKTSGGQTADVAGIDAQDLPEYDGTHYVTVNGNLPEFPADVTERASDGSGRTVPYEYYGSLDGLGRCTYAYGCLGEETMPQEGQERGDISPIHPSGWAKGQHWERCHLIAWSLSAEDANPENLITGTHYLNYDGMRPFEEEVMRYIWDTGNHVLYMVRPWFSGDELVARGVQMTARSVEDNGKGVSFNVYCFNVTPNASIDYTTGVVTTEEQAKQDARLYVINKRSGVFHYPSCEGAQSMAPHNREEVTATRSELTSQGYMPCGSCEP